MQRCVVISQPMYFPWAGLLEQIRLSDDFVFFDDVQYSRGYFNRVQIKTARGVRWLTVPVRDRHRGQLINEVRIDDRTDWRRSHRDALRQAYGTAPFRDEMLELVNEVFGRRYLNLAELSKASTLALAAYFGLESDTRFHDSSALGVPGKKSQRLINISLHLGAGNYLTGHGARHYLNHEEFEACGINVSYIDYGMRCYPQQHDEFTPYVSALDLLANLGKAGAPMLAGIPVPWRTFMVNRTW